MVNFRLIQLAEQIGGTLRGNADLAINSIAPLETATANQITFISNQKFRKSLAYSNAGAIIVTQADVEYCQDKQNLIIVKDPYLSYALLAQYMDNTPKAAQNIAISAIISPEAKIGNNVSIGANSVIEKGVILEDNVIIGAGCFIGQNSKIGANTQLWANVTIYHNVTIGLSLIHI